MFSLYLCHTWALSFFLLTHFLLYLNLANTFLEVGSEDSLYWDWNVLGNNTNNIQAEHKLKEADSIFWKCRLCCFLINKYFSSLGIFTGQSFSSFHEIICKTMTYKVGAKKIFKIYIAWGFFWKFSYNFFALSVVDTKKNTY